MNNEQMKKEVLRYLEDENYKYAILIDGEWGCGKTHFVLNELRESMEKYEAEHTGRSLRYISLYGVKTVDAVEEKVIWSIIDEKFYAGYEQLARVQEVYGERREEVKRKGRSLHGIAQKLVATVMQKMELPFKSYEYVADVLELDKNIFIFDDLERCNCPINDVLGYINGLVEHENVKVILVANEKEIGSLEQEECKELQYLVVVNNDIKIPKEKDLFGYVQNKNSQPEMNVQELERRRRKVFSDKKYDWQYMRVREKLVGITLQFEADFVTVMHQLIHCSHKDKELEEALHSKVNYFMSIMTSNEHQNLRTFQFFLSKIDCLYEQLPKMGMELQYQKQLLDFVIENCFLLCVEFKGNIKEPEDEFNKISFQNKRRMQSILRYVRASIFEAEKYREDLEKYVYAELAQRLPSDDPYCQLYNEYYIQNQQWVEDKLQRVLEGLEQNKYLLNLYPNMIYLLVTLQQYGFSEVYLDQASAYMIKNIERQDPNSHTLDMHVPTEDGNIIKECRKRVEKINSTISTVREMQWSQGMKDILQNQKDWSLRLMKYIEKICESMPFETLIISRVDTNSWMKLLLNSDAREIDYFRRFLNRIYPSNVIKRNVKKDMQVLKEISERLKQHSEQDLIKKMQISWLTEQIDEICQRNVSIEGYQ